ncbi:1-acyl-sn-glycerol-3-phosphate acyltransferase [Janthinobacterium agaricidamnosum]|uniref:Acyltransferase family protein n=1 Tax=Janthinobacterium agaricidamnosum NBRC 102515 = DSM 9628 TaxID=1349767 RepID=W0V7E5_9BURK|nr:1-acyl-sn-glycerol-3-phosphate acyltransferase [Janthinobacterium agaricidamnosum]CDG83500.1 acyltransferase family protein [Janthinobacterium agaricidamnosum NBRC 102515 = DSM 9628]
MDDFYLRPHDLPTWRQRASLRLLNLFGWRMRFRPLPGPRGIAVVYPHTSNWDFIVGLLGKWALDLPFRWLAKDSLFRGPLGKWLRSLGGEPVDRSTTSGTTQRQAQRMLAADWYWLAITPEATRSYRPNWRSGFYHLALEAKVPLLIVYMDYPNKILGVVDHVHLSGDKEVDMAAIRAACAGHQGLHPENAAPIILSDKRPNS